MDSKSRLKATTDKVRSAACPVREGGKTTFHYKSGVRSRPVPLVDVASDESRRFSPHVEFCLKDHTPWVELL